MSTICIRDGKELLEIGFSDIRKYHGGLALMAVSVGFRTMQAAFAELFGNIPPERQSLSILSGHAGPGFRDAFEYVTRAVTRGVYQVDVEYPRGQYDPYRPQAYAFVISADHLNSSVEVTLQENFLPAIFYDYLKKGREGTMTEKEKEDFDELKATLSEKALKLPQDELLIVRKKEEGVN